MCFVKGQDFYSAVGIRQFGITDASPYKDDSKDSFPEKYPCIVQNKSQSMSAFFDPISCVEKFSSHFFVFDRFQLRILLHFQNGVEGPLYIPLHASIFISRESVTVMALKYYFYFFLKKALLVF